MTFPPLCTMCNNVSFFLDKDNTAIIVGVTIPIIMLLTLLGIGLLIRKRNKKKNQRRKTTETRTTDDLSLPDSVIETR